ncbi:MAG TPA: DegT/DnrJ/EryC1/StrS family aminotransferase [Lunatimonas sp.]|nr:DegT/DnrJ/EryC1/StrS family aminotransferase [Lunatimonas sp.]
MHKSEQAATSKKIWLSSPHMGGAEECYVKEAFDTNWVAPLGPNVNGFEDDIVRFTDCGHAAALTSGTGAIHLALSLLGVGAGDFVLCQSFTFSASANPIRYLGAIPVFIDSEEDTWNMCPIAMEQAILSCQNGVVSRTFPSLELPISGSLPKAIIVVDLYGMPAKHFEICEIAAKYGIPVVEDAAEALGSSLNGKHCGTFGDIGIYSFNGNKIITTSGGGALVSSQENFVNKARYLSTQAREDAPHYEHSEIGYNYRLSNICAGIGRGQMEVLPERVRQRRSNYDRYRSDLANIPGIIFLQEPEGYFSNRWLTTILIDPILSGGISREDVRLSLAEGNIESRPLWKPMHLQPVFKQFPFYGNEIAAQLFDQGLCLPSGSNLELSDLDFIIDRTKKTLNSK